MSTDNLLDIPKDAGRIMLKRGGVFLCPLLKASDFAKFCTDRGFRITRERLLKLERLRLFFPVVRVREPDEDRPPLALPLQDEEWFDRGWAIDTASRPPDYDIPEPKHCENEAYYSPFQLTSLRFVHTELTSSLALEGFLASDSFNADEWRTRGETLFQIAHQIGESARDHTYRPAVDLLCQYVSDRYYPHARSNQRTRQVSGSGGYAEDEWTTRNALKWDWGDYARAWDPHDVQELFNLTPANLRHAYDGLATSQEFEDPLASWYQLVQFMAVRERDRLKDNALGAETTRSGALMVRQLYKDLYGELLPHPNEMTGTIITHIPELDVRGDPRRYLEFVVNRYELNPRPALTLFVEGASEAVAVELVFERYFGTSPGNYGIEIVVLGGVDNATGTKKEDRFRAILRLVDYLHHHQTFAFLILDNERYARKLKEGAKDAKSIMHGSRYVTRSEYIKVWKDSFEFDNFSATEIAAALSTLAAGKGTFTKVEVALCQTQEFPGASLSHLFEKRVGKKPNKVELTELLVTAMLSPAVRRKIENRPFVKVLSRVARLAARNPFPTMFDSWERNQTSTYLGKARGPRKRKTARKK